VPLFMTLKDMVTSFPFLRNYTRYVHRISAIFGRRSRRAVSKLQGRSQKCQIFFFWGGGGYIYPHTPPSLRPIAELLVRGVSKALSRLTSSFSEVDTRTLSSADIMKLSTSTRTVHAPHAFIDNAFTST